MTTRGFQKLHSDCNCPLLHPHPDPHQSPAAASLHLYSTAPPLNVHLKRRSRPGGAPFSSLHTSPPVWRKPRCFCWADWPGSVRGPDSIFLFARRRGCLSIGAASGGGLSGLLITVFSPACLPPPPDGLLHWLMGVKAGPEQPPRSAGLHDSSVTERQRNKQSTLTLQPNS